MDNFYEQLISTKKSTKYNIANVGMYVTGFLAITFIGGAQLIPGIALILIGVGLFFLKKKFFVEYEYVCTNGEIDIDKIIEMKKRVRVISFHVKDAEIIAPEDSYHVKDFANKPEKIINCIPEGCEMKPYIAMLTGGTVRAQLKFVPSQELIDICFKYNPRAIKKA